MPTSKQIREKIRLLLVDSAGHVLNIKIDPSAVPLESPRNENFGDYSSSFVLRIAKEAKQPPQVLAKKIAERFEASLAAEGLSAVVLSTSVDGPGFINISLHPSALVSVLGEILDTENFGRGEKKEGKVLLEYVSANPTGPLTVAHGRQAALGDSLARLLRFAGREVDSEYYNNDEGVQINTLGRSLELRFRELPGEKVEMPETAYRGAYLVDVARELKALADAGKAKLPAVGDERIRFCSRFAREAIMRTIEKDLADFGVAFDNFYSQEALGKSGKVEKTLEELKRRGFVYEEEGAVWFRSTDLGDDKNRVLRKSDGNYTYLTPDVAYHDDKFRRGYTDLINIWGPDHHGYIPRLVASQKALGHDGARIRVLIAQLVTLYKEKEQVRMSTRAGEFVTLREILDEVGRDAARFFFCMRKLDSHLDFDLELAKKQAPDNPVYYAQYAHARVASIRKLQEECGVRWDRNSADLARLTAPEEIRLLRAMRQFPHAAEGAALQLEPCILVEYLGTLAAAFHQFYAQCRVVTDDAPLTQARLTLAFALQKLIRTGLDLLGVSAPDKM